MHPSVGDQLPPGATNTAQPGWGGSSRGHRHRQAGDCRVGHKGLFLGEKAIC